jgi:diacylglycerol O-acyltransferase / wax synthase
MRQLTALDAQFLAMESARQYGHVSGLQILDPSTAPGGQITTKDLCRVIGERIHLIPPFRWKLVNVPFDLDQPYWIEDPDFDLDFHIREAAIPPPGDDRQLAGLIERIVGRPLDRARPLWEIYLIFGLQDGRQAILTKVHHSAVDGVSGAEILTTLLDPSPEGRDVPPPKRRRRAERIPSQLEMLARGLGGLPRQPVRAIAALPQTVPHADQIPGINQLPGVGLFGRMTRRAVGLVPGARGEAEILGSTPTRAPRTLFNGPISAQRRFAFATLSLDRVKAIKNATGVTVNDAVVALCATAVRNWLLEHDELPTEPLVAMVPVSVRSEEQQGTFGNRVSAMFVPIPTDEPDTRRRLERTHEILRGAKERFRAMPADLLTDLTRFVPSAIAARASRTTLHLTTLSPVRPALNLVISNVPGPRQPLFLAGARLQAYYPVSVITEGVGLNITVQSYLDRLDFGIVVDRDQVDDVWTLMDAMRDAFDELERTVCHQKAARPSRERAAAAATT